MQVHVFTASVDFLKIVFEICTVNRVYCERNRVSADLFDFCKWHEIEILLINELPSPEKLLGRNSEVKLAIVFGFGLIFERTHISAYPFGIWNVHPGELPKYRGRHPITSAFINNEKSIGIVIHKINENIDQGELLAIDYVSREYKDTENLVMSKIISKLRSGLLLEAFKNYTEGKSKPIPYAPYNANFLDGIKIENSILFTQEFLYNAFLAQADYGGVEIQGERFHIAHFYNEEVEQILGGAKIKCSNGYLLIFKKT